MEILFSLWLIIFSSGEMPVILVNEGQPVTADTEPVPVICKVANLRNKAKVRLSFFFAVKGNVEGKCNTMYIHPYSNQ